MKSRTDRTPDPAESQDDRAVLEASEGEPLANEGDPGELAQAALPRRTTEPGQGLRGADRVLDFVSRYSVLIGIVFFFGLFSILLPDVFPTTDNVKAMVNSQAVLVILAITATVVLRLGDFDVSIATNMIFSAAVFGELVTHGMPAGLAVLIALLAGLGVGVVNAALVVGVGLNGLIVTLGMFTALSGFAFLVTDGAVLGNFPNSLVTFAQHDFLTIPAATWYGWALVLIAYYVYEHTPIGRYMLFIGGNQEAARLAGIPVKRIRAAGFMLSGLLSAFAGLVLAGTLNSVDPATGNQYLLQPLAAAFLGATTIKVGRFNAIGTLAALYLLVVGITGLQLYGVQNWIIDVFNGSALVLAVLFARLAVLRKQRRRAAVVQSPT